jgi:hypothetical protein
MANARSRKREIDKAKREKAQQKRDRQRNPQPEADVDPDAVAEVEPAGAPRTEEELLADLQALHQQFDDGDLSFDDFDEAKAALLAQLTPE